MSGRITWYAASHLHPEGSAMYCPRAIWRGVTLESLIDVRSLDMRLWRVKDATGKVIAEGRCNRWSVKSMMVNEASKALDALEVKDD